MAKEFAGVPIVANSFAPDVLADEALGFELINGTIRITFAVVKMSDGAPPSDVELQVIGRLVMGIGPAQRLAEGLFDYMKQRNLTVDDAAAGGETPQ